MLVAELPDDCCILFLGDPGSGKTTCMTAAAKARGGEFLPVRTFLCRFGWRPPAGTTLFLDALDEALADGPDNPARAVAKALYEAGAPRFWLSCRPVDWNGLAGESLLEDCAGTGQLLTVRLLPLDDASVEHIVSEAGQDPDQFLRQVQTARLAPLLRNPETLNLMLTIATKGDGLPSSRHALYERATRILLEEANTTRPRPVGHRPPPPDAVLEAAGIACAVLILADRDTVTFIPASANPDERSVAVDEIDPYGTHTAALRAAIGSRLFADTSDGRRWAPQHRTIAEYLAAAFLARLVSNNGYPLRRLLALILGHHGEPHPALRGLFGWLCTLLPSDAVRLVQHDPYGVLAYGDPTILSPQTLTALLSALRELERREPYFRRGLWGEAQFAVLSSAALVDSLHHILEERPWRGHLASCILEALAEGEPRPELIPTLIETVLDASLATDDRADVVPALLNACRRDCRPAVDVFRRLVHEPGLDASRTLATQFLVRLYPKSLTLSDLADFAAYYALGNDRATTSDSSLLKRSLVPLVPSGQEAAILDSWAEQDWITPRRAFSSRAETLGRVALCLVVRALPTFQSRNVNRLVGWLNVVGDLDRQETRWFEAANTAFSLRPDLFVPMAIAATELAPREALREPRQAGSNLRLLAQWWQWPTDGGQRLLDAGLIESVPFRRELLFSFSLQLCFCRNDFNLFERVYAEADFHPDLAAILSCFCFQQIPSEQDYWQRHDIRRRREYEECRRHEHAELLRNLHEHLPQIAAGTATHELYDLANIWLGLCSRGEDKKLEPAERLVRETDREVLAAALAGWRTLASEGQLPTPAQLGKSRVDNCIWIVEVPAVLGAGLLFNDAGMDMPPLAEPRLGSLIALGLLSLSISSYGEIDHSWVGRIAALSPHAAEVAVRDLLGLQLDAGCHSVSGLYQVCQMPELAAIRQVLLPELLVRVRTGQVLECLIGAALRELPADILLGVIRRRISAADGLDAAVCWWLLVAGWLLSPDEFAVGIETAVTENSELLNQLAESTGETLFGSRFHSKPVLSLTHRKFLARLCGPAWPPAPLVDGVHGVSSAADLARFVARQFEGIASDPSSEATSVLAALLANPALIAHRPMIQNAIAQRRRDEIRRGWETPSPAKLVATLQDGPPATAADLKAFAEDHLRSLNDALRTTQDNSWKGFWDGKSDEPKIENDCRDHLCVLLRQWFVMAGLQTQVEVRGAGDDRCDIVVRSLKVTLPIEVKGEWHPELWTAWQDQLGDRYAREPSSGGQGIYLVLWFGRASLKDPTSGAGIDDPRVLECALQSLVDETGYRLLVVVLNASKPGPRRPQAPRKVTSGRPPAGRRRTPAGKSENPDC